MLDMNKETGERALKHFQKKHKDRVMFMLVDVTVKDQLVTHSSCIECPPQNYCY